MRNRLASALLLPLVLLAGCQTVSPEARVREKLIGAGLPPAVAQCMAQRMVAKLSIAQLRALGEAANVPGQNIKQMSIDELMRRLRALNDPEIVIVVTRAAIGCEIAGG